jgi:hypothetical protein
MGIHLMDPAIECRIHTPEAPVSNVQFDFIDKHEAAKLLKIHPGTLNRYRQEGKLTEGVHFIRLSSQTIRYNKALLEDWAANLDDPAAHRRAIEVFITSLLGNQFKQRRSSSHQVR